ncbi:MAG: hypothetical protein ACRCVE_12710 [Plesiomonas sp.]
MTDISTFKRLPNIPIAHSVEQIIPATGWFFQQAKTGKVIPVAAWCKSHDGMVYGMIAPTSGDFGHLAINTGEGGVYKHESEL